MDKAKTAIEGFLGAKDQHNVTVDEQVAPALTNETIHRSREEVIQPVIDREVHKTHHHTTLQPVKDQAILPETHEHQAHGVEQRVMHHGDNTELERGLAAEREKFRDRQHVMPTQVTETVAPAAVGEHVHHHVVETIQPVIQKDTHQHHVVHHTKPIHEVHHEAPRHHEATALPAVSIEQFRAQGGSLTGKGPTHDEFTGHRDIEGILGHPTGGITSQGTTGTGMGSNTTGMGSNTTGMGSGGSGPHNSSMQNKLDPRVDSDGSKGYGAGSTSGSGSGYGSNTTNTGSSGATGPVHSSGLLNKLDPRVKQ